MIWMCEYIAMWLATRRLVQRSRRTTIRAIRKWTVRAELLVIRGMPLTSYLGRHPVSFESGQLKLVTQSNRNDWVRFEQRHAVVDLGLLRLDVRLHKRIGGDAATIDARRITDTSG